MNTRIALVRGLFPALFLTILLSATETSAQDHSGTAQTETTITGIVQNRLGHGIADCGVALWRQSDTTLVAGTMTDAEGRFSFERLAPADYYIRLGGILYREQTIPIRSASGTTHLQPITLVEQEHQLSEVSVVGRAPLISMTPEGEVHYRLSADPLASKGASLYDVLRRVPLVTPSQGGLMIRGSVQPLFYVNGVLSPMLNNNPREALKAMRAGHVKEIQIIPHPGAEYDGDFSGGIINIITKRLYDSQYTATLGLTGNTRHQYGGTGNLLARIGTLSISGDLAYSGQSDYRESYGLDRTSPGSSSHYRLVRDKERDYYLNRYILGSSFLSWTISPRDLINMTVDYYRLDTDGTGTQAHTMYDRGGDVTYRFGVDELSKTAYESVNASAGYQHKWGGEGLLSILYQYSDLPKTVDDTFEVVDPQGYQGKSRHIAQRTHNKSHTAQLDLADSWAEHHRLSGGIKGIVRLNTSDTQLRTRAGSEDWADEPTPEDRFSHRQDVLALYAQYKYLSDRWDLRAGLRNEWTREHVSYPTQEEGEGDDLRKHFSDLLVSLSAGYSITPSSSLSVHYRSSITRPSIYHLNPRVTISDPSYIYYGNPRLSSEKHHSLGFDWSFYSEAVMLSLSGTYKYSPNGIQPSYGVRPDGVMYRTFNNSGKYHEGGMSLYGSYSSGQLLTLSLTGYLLYKDLRGMLAGDEMHRSGFTGGLSGNMDFNLPKGYYLSLYGGYDFPTITLEGTGFNFYHCGGMLSKSLLDDRLTLSLTAQDFLWRTKTYHRTFNTPDFKGSSTYQNYGILIELGVSYRINLEIVKVKKLSNRIRNTDVAEFSDK